MVPQCMRVARLYDLDDIRVEEAPVPQIGRGEALVRVAVCGICSSDVLPWYIRRKAPLVFGHELVGTVVEIGPGVEGFEPRDRVFIHHHAPCMVCRLCRRGHYSMCPTWASSALDPGGLAEYVRVPALNLRTDTLHLPGEVTFEDGSLTEPTACVVQALKRRARMRREDQVLVIGMGFMGQTLALLARHYGAGVVIAADRVPYRLQKALDLGADLCIDVSEVDLLEEVAAATDGAMADLVVVGPGTPTAIRSELTTVGVGGTVLFFTPTEPDETVAIRPHELYFKDATLVTSYSSGPPDTREALDMIGRGVITAGKLVTHRYPLDRVAEGFAAVAEADDSLKTIIVMDPETRTPA